MRIVLSGRHSRGHEKGKNTNEARHRGTSSVSRRLLSACGGRVAGRMETHTLAEVDPTALTIYTGVYLGCRTLSAHAGVEREITKERERQRPLPYGLVRWRAITYQPQLRLDRGWTPFSWRQTHRKRRSVHSYRIPGRYRHS